MRERERSKRKSCRICSDPKEVTVDPNSARALLAKDRPSITLRWTERFSGEDWGKYSFLI